MSDDSGIQNATCFISCPGYQALVWLCVLTWVLICDLAAACLVEYMQCFLFSFLPIFFSPSFSLPYSSGLVCLRAWPLTARGEGSKSQVNSINPPGQLQTSPQLWSKQSLDHAGRTGGGGGRRGSEKASFWLNPAWRTVAYIYIYIYIDQKWKLCQQQMCSVIVFAVQIVQCTEKVLLSCYLADKRRFKKIPKQTCEKSQPHESAYTHKHAHTFGRRTELGNWGRSPRKQKNTSDGLTYCTLERCINNWHV